MAVPTPRMVAGLATGVAAVAVLGGGLALTRDFLRFDGWNTPQTGGVDTPIVLAPPAGPSGLDATRDGRPDRDRRALPGGTVLSLPGVGGVPVRITIPGSSGGTGGANAGGGTGGTRAPEQDAVSKVFDDSIPGAGSVPSGPLSPAPSTPAPPVVSGSPAPAAGIPIVAAQPVPTAVVRVVSTDADNNPRADEQLVSSSADNYSVPPDTSGTAVTPATPTATAPAAAVSVTAAPAQAPAPAETEPATLTPPSESAPTSSTPASATPAPADPTPAGTADPAPTGSGGSTASASASDPNGTPADPSTAPAPSETGSTPAPAED